MTIDVQRGSFVAIVGPLERIKGMVPTPSTNGAGCGHVEILDTVNLEGLCNCSTQIPPANNSSRIEAHDRR